MIGITSIGTYVPTHKIDNYDRMEQFNTNSWFLDNKTGFRFLARKEETDETSDLCVKAFQALQNKTGLKTEEIQCAVVITQNPDGKGLPHSSAWLHRKLGLPVNTACFDISLGCSGYVYGLSILKCFMEGNGFTTGVLFTADPYSKILDENDRNTELLFGDASSCTLMTDKPRYSIGKTCFATDGTRTETIWVNPATGKFEMKGQAVFKFSLQKVPAQITECLEKNQLAQEEVDLFIVHQGSRYIVDNLADILKLSNEKLPFTAAEVGNTVSSTIPLTLESLVDSARPGKILLSGFGVGLSWASTVITKQHAQI
jgi:3-oxoacyl-[acyl-carrier-protein] synthase III